MTATAVSPEAVETPSLRRRLASFVYEGVLLFGIVMVVGLVYGGLTQQRHAMVGHHGLQATLFVVIGLYFVAFWTRGGQTVAMKTWRIRLLSRDGSPVTPSRAVLRYLLSWLWFLPALITMDVASTHSAAAIALGMLVGVAGYAASSLLTPGRQFWHDLLSGTRLVSWPPAAPR